MAKPQMKILNIYDNSYQASNPITGNGYNVANAHDSQKALVVTLADASTVTIPAGFSATIDLTGTKAFSSIAQASSPQEAGATVQTPANLQ